MQFISGTFLIFFFLAFLLYFITKKEYRYLVLLLCNYVFYGWNNLSSIPILLLATALTYIGGLVLGKKKSRLYYALFFALTILILVFYKYLNFLIDNVNLAIGLVFAGKEGFSNLDILTPLGLSFFIFQSTGYLGDVYRKGMAPEKNFFRYAAFVSFFPTVVSGPIQLSRELLPQLKQPLDFEFQRARKGFLLLIWGFFQKMVICAKFSEISNLIFDQYENYDNVYYLTAAICYSFYIYCDFSSYSDMACGVAQILGFRVRENFRNPYLSQSIGEFWNRWHMSLNTWFIENIYIPLGGSRKGAFRKYLNIFAVFFFSGIWHGASWSFIFWGALNGILRIFGDVLKPFRQKTLSVLHISSENKALSFVRRGFVFLMITVTWVFFRMPDVSAAFHIVKNMLLFFPSSLLNFSVSSIFGNRIDQIVFLLVLLLFSLLQYARREEGKLYPLLRKAPVVLQYVGAAVMIAICVITACSGTTTFDTQFIYFQF